MSARPMPGSEDQTPGASPPRVCLFGLPEVTGATGPAPMAYTAGRATANHTARATELIAYLATNRRGVTSAQLAAVHSPQVLRSPATLHSLVSRMRRWLGADERGAPWLPRAQAGGVFVLDRRVRTDWEEWLELVGTSPAKAPTESLAAALALVRGQPVAGTAPARWGWADDLRQTMTESISEACHELIARHVESGDLAKARRTAAFGRTLDPADERIWRDALHVELTAGDADAQRRLIAQLVRIGSRPEDLEPETAELLAERRR